MRVFIASLATETNTFAPFPTGWEGFGGASALRRPGESVGPLAGPMRVYRARAEADGHDLVESITAFAQPSGATVRAVYETLRDAILDNLRQAARVDMILLMLHGAMVAAGYDDCEGDLIARVRAIAPDAVIGVELDPHCHLTTAMIEGADLIIIGKEYPHTDLDDRAHELYTLCTRVAAGEIAPCPALVDLRMVGFYPTLGEPMRTIVAELSAKEVAPILSVSLAHGFPWGDTPDMGTRVLVYADASASAAAAVAADLARRIYTARDALLPRFPDLEQSLTLAEGLSGLSVLGDFADNAGGGAPSDSTFVLDAVLKRGLTDIAIGAFWDPLVAQVAADAGVGATIKVRLGGKCGPASGDPLDLDAEIMQVREHHDQGAFGQRQPMGRSVWLRTRGVDIVVCSTRTQLFEPDAFTGLGISLHDKRMVIVKSSNHFQAGFAPIADHIWAMRTPGTLGIDFAHMGYVKRAGDYFPRVPDPWAEYGVPSPKTFPPQPRRNSMAGVATPKPGRR